MRRAERGEARAGGARVASGAAAFAALVCGLSGRGLADSPPAPPPSPALATFDGGQITVAAFEAAVANKAPLLRTALRQQPEQERMLHALVDYALLIQEATRRGYADRDEVRVAMLIELTHRVEAAVALTVDEATLPEADLRAYYASHREQLAIPPMRRATFVRAATQKEAAELASQARRMTISAFRDLALARGRAGKGEGGELPYVDAQGRPAGVVSAKPVDRALVDRAFALAQDGQVSEPFEHGGGFVVVRLTGSTAGAAMRFEDAEKQVRAGLATERRAQAQAALEQQLRAEYPVEVHPDLSDRIVLDPAPAADIPAGFPAAPPDPRAPTLLAEPDDA